MGSPMYLIFILQEPFVQVGLQTRVALNRVQTCAKAQRSPLIQSSQIKYQTLQPMYHSEF